MRNHNKIRSRTGLFAGFLCVILLAGCAKKEEIYQEIHLDRSTSFARWNAQHKAAAAAENVVKEDLNLDKALGIALENNKQILKMASDKKAAHGRILESYSLALPTVNLNGNYTRLDEVASFDVGGRSVSLGSADNYSLSLEAKQPIFRGGAIGAGIRAANLYSYLIDESIRQVVQSVIYQVTQTFDDVLLAQQILAANQEAFGLSLKHLDDVKARRRQGVASDYDVLRAQVEVSNYEAEVIQSRNRLNLLKTSFCKLLGISQESEITLQGELAYQQCNTELIDAVSQALSKRPELVQAEIKYRLDTENLKSKRAARYPVVDLFFNKDYSYPDPHSSTTLEWGDAWTAGLTMSLPIFDGFENRGKIQQARAALEKSRIEIADQEEQVLLEVKQALLSIRDADSLVKSQQKNMERAQQGLKLVEAGYKEGVNTELEVRDARQALLHARTLHYQAIHQHLAAVLQLQKATGELAPPGQVQQNTVSEQPQPQQAGSEDVQ